VSTLPCKGNSFAENKFAVSQPSRPPLIRYARRHRPSRRRVTPVVTMRIAHRSRTCGSSCEMNSSRERISRSDALITDPVAGPTVLAEPSVAPTPAPRIEDGNVVMTDRDLTCFREFHVAGRALRFGRTLANILVTAEFAEGCRGTRHGTSNRAAWRLSQPSDPSVAPTPDSSFSMQCAVIQTAAVRCGRPEGGPNPADIHEKPANRPCLGYLADGAAVKVTLRWILRALEFGKRCFRTPSAWPRWPTL